MTLSSTALLVLFVGFKIRDALSISLVVVRLRGPARSAGWAKVYFKVFRSSHGCLNVILWLGWNFLLSSWSGLALLWVGKNRSLQSASSSERLGLCSFSNLVKWYCFDCCRERSFDWNSSTSSSQLHCRMLYAGSRITIPVLTSFLTKFVTFPLI